MFGRRWDSSSGRRLRIRRTVAVGVSILAVLAFAAGPTMAAGKPTPPALAFSPSAVN